MRHVEKSRFLRDLGDRFVRFDDHVFCDQHPIAIDVIHRGLSEIFFEFFAEQVVERYLLGEIAIDIFRNGNDADIVRLFRALDKRSVLPRVFLAERDDERKGKGISEKVVRAIGNLVRLLFQFVQLLKEEEDVFVYFPFDVEKGNGIRIAQSGIDVKQEIERGKNA